MIHDAAQANVPFPFGEVAYSIGTDYDMPAGNSNYPCSSHIHRRTLLDFFPAKEQKNRRQQLPHRRHYKRIRRADIQMHEGTRETTKNQGKEEKHPPISRSILKAQQMFVND